MDPSTRYVRFSDDTAMLALFSDFASFQSYVSSVVRFSNWCSKKILHLNVSKTKEMCIDFRRNRTVNSPLSSTVNLWNRLILSSTSVLS